MGAGEGGERREDSESTNRKSGEHRSPKAAIGGTGTGDRSCADERERLIGLVRAYALGTQKQVTMRQFCAAMGLEEGRVHREFGGVRELLAAAGLGHRASRRGRIDFDVLMERLAEVERLVGRVPTPGDVDRVGRVTARTYYDRMGSWGKVREEYSKWQSSNSKSQVRKVEEGHRSSGAMFGGTGDAREEEHRSPKAAIGGTGIGRPLALEGMVFAPTCEAGVVFLFGLLAREMGYVVERVGTAFPDCTALRRSRGPGPERWERIAVEFEYRSSNFRAHGHDAAACDVIVCWEHDWKESPVQVVELKEVVERVRVRGAA